MVNERRTSIGITSTDGTSSDDQDLVTVAWVKQHVAEAVDAATQALTKSFEERLAKLATAPVITEPPKPTKQPEILVGTRDEFVDAVKTIKSGKAVAGVDDMFRITLKSNIDLTGEFDTVLDGLKSTIIDGSGFKFTRSAHQIDYRMFNCIRMDRVTFQNVGFDDSADGKYGPMGKTKQMVWIRMSTNIVMDNVYVANSKGYAVYVQQTHGFKFINSEMEKSGILGLYVGHGDDKQSSNVVIDNNHFHDNATNAVAILGVSGEVENYVTNNTFERNHIYGRWAVAPKYGTGFTGGGQLYLAQVDNMLVKGNVVKDGFCLNCIDKSTKKIKNVAGIEISGLYGDVIKVTRLTITDNDVFNNDGKGITQNLNSKLDNTTKIFGNRVHDNGKDFSVQDIPNAA